MYCGGVYFAYLYASLSLSLLQVVVKFLRKSSVLKDCWVQDSEMGLVPREISLLARLSHPNIVQVGRNR